MIDFLFPAFLFGTFFVFALLDRFVPARRLPRIALWRVKGVLFLALAYLLATRGPLLWDGWLAQHTWIDATGLGHVGGAIVGFLVLQICVYAWHRALHTIPFLWRHVHQMHHSAERIDVFGAFYAHPFDTLGFALVGSFALVFVLGLTLPAAIAAGLATTFCNMFQHANLKTPHWLGYLIQRPESHTLHHSRNVHGFNYGDIPLFDIVLGTFRNPRNYAGETGFYLGASRRIGEMLIGRDVSKPRAATARAARYPAGEPPIARRRTRAFRTTFALRRTTRNRLSVG